MNKLKVVLFALALSSIGIPAAAGAAENDCSGFETAFNSAARNVERRAMVLQRREKAAARLEERIQGRLNDFTNQIDRANALSRDSAPSTKASYNNFVITIDARRRRQAKRVLKSQGLYDQAVQQLSLADKALAACRENSPRAVTRLFNVRYPIFANLPYIPEGNANAPYYQPGLANAPYVQPGLANAPYTQPGLANAPFTQPGLANAPYTAPGLANAPYTAPGLANAPYTEPGLANAPHTEQGLANAPYVKPGLANAPHTEQGLANAPYTKPGLANAPYIKPGLANPPYIPPGAANPTVAPPSSDKRKIEKRKIRKSKARRKNR